MIEEIKAALALIRKMRLEKKNQKQLVKAPFNYNYLQTLVNSVATSTAYGAVIEIVYPDGHRVLIKRSPQPEQRVPDYQQINGAIL